jgi:hypothetical protein
MIEHNIDFNTNCYSREYNQFDEQDRIFERTLLEQDEEKFNMHVKLNHCIGE